MSYDRFSQDGFDSQFWENMSNSKTWKPSSISNQAKTQSSFFKSIQKNIKLRKSKHHRAQNSHEIQQVISPGKFSLKSTGTTNTVKKHTKNPTTLIKSTTIENNKQFSFIKIDPKQENLKYSNSANSLPKNYTKFIQLSNHQSNSQTDKHRFNHFKDKYAKIFDQSLSQLNQTSAFSQSTIHNYQSLHTKLKSDDQLPLLGDYIKNLKKPEQPCKSNQPRKLKYMLMRTTTSQNITKNRRTGVKNPFEYLYRNINDSVIGECIRDILKCYDTLKQFGFTEQQILRIAKACVVGSIKIVAALVLDVLTVDPLTEEITYSSVITNASEICVRVKNALFEQTESFTNMQTHLEEYKQKLETLVVEKVFTRISEKETALLNGARWLGKEGGDKTKNYKKIISLGFRSLSEFNNLEEQFGTCEKVSKMQTRIFQRLNECFKKLL